MGPIAADFGDDIFNELYIKHNKRVHLLVLRMVKIREDAEDITQETFIRAYSHFHKLDARAPIFAWLCKIATNLCIDAARKNMNIQLISLEGCYVADQLEERCERIMKSINLGQNVEMEEMMLLVNKAMDTLPPHYCQVMILRVCEQLSAKETAKIMGISAAMVDTLLYRTRKRIKKLYLELSEGFQA